MVNKPKAVTPATKEEVKTLTNEERLDKLEAENKELRAMVAKKGYSSDPLEAKRQKQMEKDNCRWFGICSIDKEGNWEVKGQSWGRGGTSVNAEGPIKQAANKLVKRLIEYNEKPDGTYTIKNPEITFLIKENYTDFAIPITIKLELVESKPVMKNGIDVMKNSKSGYPKSVEYIFGERVQLDLSKKIVKSQKE
jgi:hypothetical protein